MEALVRNFSAEGRGTHTIKSTPAFRILDCRHEGEVLAKLSKVLLHNYHPLRPSPGEADQRLVPLPPVADVCMSPRFIPS